MTAGRPRLDLHRIKNFIEHELMPEIREWLERREPDEPLGNSLRVTRATLELETVRSHSRSYPHLETITAEIHVVTKEGGGSKDAIIGGAVTPIRQHSGENSIGVYVFMNSSLTPESYFKYKMKDSRLEDQVQYGLYQLLIHELTHAVEAIFDKPRAYDPENVDWDVYYNDPKEVRAFMQQIVDEVVDWAAHDAVRRRAKGNNQALVEWALKMSSNWKQVSSHLTPANKRLVLRTVYTELERNNRLFVV